MNTSEIKIQLSLCESQLANFNAKSSKTSATRARCHLSQIVKLANALRKDILCESKANSQKRKEAKSKKIPEIIPTVEAVAEVKRYEDEEEAPILVVKKFKKIKKSRTKKIV